MATTTVEPDLPVWMKRALRRTDWGVLMALAFSLIAGWSFALQPGFFRMNANENYIFRTANYARTLGEGRLYPRWTAETLNGYGAPIPHYSPPGAGYLPALIQQLYTNDPVQAVRLMYIFSFVLAGTSMYALITRRLNAACGLIATLLYVYSPYLALTAPHILGDLPVVIGLALLPAFLWSIDRFVLMNQPPDLLLLGLLSAGLLMTEPRIMAAAMLIAVMWLVLYERKRPVVLISTLVGMGFGVLLAAIFWLPAVIEHDVVQWITRGVAQRPMVRLSSLFAPLQMLDPGAMLPIPQFTIGLASIIAVLASLPAILHRKRALPTLFLLIAFATIAVLIAFPHEVWLMGIVAFGLAIAGSAVGMHRFMRQRRWALPITLAGFLTLSFPVWIAPGTSELGMDTSPEAQLLYEQLGYGIAVLPPDAPLPTTLADTTSSTSPGINGKLAIGQSSGQIGTLSHRTHSDVFQLLLTEPISLQILTSYFPGWNATFRGNSVRVSPHPEGGLMINLATPDRGELVVSLGTTPPRLMGWVITLVSFGLLLQITFWRYRQPNSRYVHIDQLTNDEARAGGGVLIILLFVLAFLSTGIFTAPSGYALDSSISLRAQTDTGLELLAYQMDRTDDTINLTLYWRAARFLPENYQAQVSLVNTETQEQTQIGAPRNPGGFPTRRWLTNLYVADSYEFMLPTEGSYAAAVEVFTSTQARLSFFTSNGIAMGTQLALQIDGD